LVDTCALLTLFGVCLQVAIRATFLERENKILAQELRKARAENHLLKERLCKYEIIQ
jgi:hypothetical protein